MRIKPSSPPPFHHYRSSARFGQIDIISKVEKDTLYTAMQQPKKPADKAAALLKGVYAVINRTSPETPELDQTPHFRELPDGRGVIISDKNAKHISLWTLWEPDQSTDLGTHAKTETFIGYAKTAMPQSIIYHAGAEDPQ